MNLKPARMSTLTNEPIEQWIERNAARILHVPAGTIETDALQLKLGAVTRRPSAHLHRFTVTGGGQTVNVLVKQRPQSVAARFPTPTGHWALFSSPSWTPPPQFEDRSAAEYNALASIDQHFKRIKDSRFTTVEPFLLDRDSGAVAMRELEGESLDRLLLKGPTANTTSGPGGDVLLERAGAWLQKFHTMPQSAASQWPPAHHESREDLRSALGLLADGLPVNFAPSRQVRALADRLAPQLELLPDQLPLGLAHGDFWSGNVLVDALGAVAVIDTFAASRTPVFEDLAYFTFELKRAAAKRGRLPHGHLSERAVALESHFLRGYFPAGEVPIATLRRFELCVLLRKWAGRCKRASAHRGPKKLWKRLRLASEAREFESVAQELFDAIAATDNCPATPAKIVLEPASPQFPSNSTRAAHGR